MFKIFCFKYRNQIQIIRSLYRKSYLDFNYSRTMQKKKKLKIYTRDYIVRLHNLLKFRVYYGDMTIKKFRKYLQKINTRRLDFESKICFLLESRLDILLFRLNLVKTPREAREYIKRKKIKINNNIIHTLNYQLYINDIISFNKNFSTYL
jgi:ribosomal protein S4